MFVAILVGFGKHRIWDVQVCLELCSLLYLYERKGCLEFFFYYRLSYRTSPMGLIVWRVRSEGEGGLAKGDIATAGAIHCHRMPYTVIHCQILPYISIHCHTLPIAILCQTLSCIDIHCHTWPHITIHCHTLPCIAKHCSTLSYIAIQCLSLPYIAKHFQTLPAFHVFPPPLSPSWC